MRETDVDCMKHRKSTHLAGVDVEVIVSEKGHCNLTIKQAFYEKGVDVSGSKTDGYFIDFVEDVKPMVANSTNRKTIALIVKDCKQLSSIDSRNVKNWTGLVIDLYFDPTVKMMGSVVGGIKVKPTVVVAISDENAKAILNKSKTIPELQDNWSKLTKQEQGLPTVNALKEQLKTQLT